MATDPITRTYAEIYENPATGIIRSEEDAHILCVVNGSSVKPGGTWPPQTYEMVLDRKWGELQEKSVELLLYLRGEGSVGSQRAVTFAANDWWWGCIHHAGQIAQLEAIGGRHLDSALTKEIDTGFGVVEYVDGLNYEFVEAYLSDGSVYTGGQGVNLRVGKRVLSDNSQVVDIRNTNSVPTPIMTWKLRVTKGGQQ